MLIMHQVRTFNDRTPDNSTIVYPISVQIGEVTPFVLVMANARTSRCHPRRTSHAKLMTQNCTLMSRWPCMTVPEISCLASTILLPLSQTARSSSTRVTAPQPRCFPIGGILQSEQIVGNQSDFIHHPAIVGRRRFQFLMHPDALVISFITVMFSANLCFE